MAQMHCSHQPVKSQPHPIVCAVTNPTRGQLDRWNDRKIPDPMRKHKYENAKQPIDLPRPIYTEIGLLLQCTPVSRGTLVRLYCIKRAANTQQVQQTEKKQALLETLPLGEKRVTREAKECRLPINNAEIFCFMGIVKTAPLHDGYDFRVRTL